MSISVLLVLVAAPSAVAQKGSEVDPDSPAGVEYRLPLNKRKDATGGGGAKAGSPKGSAAKGAAAAGAAAAGAAPLFGLSVRTPPLS